MVIVLDASATDTAAIFAGRRGADTVSVVVPLLPSEFAPIVTVPGETPVTSPVDDTVATDVLPDFHVTARDVRTLPAASVSMAFACVVCCGAMLVLADVTVTDATAGGFTTTMTLDETPSLVAVTVVEPDARPITVAVLASFVVAATIVGSETDQVIARFLS